MTSDLAAIDIGISYHSPLLRRLASAIGWGFISFLAVVVALYFLAITLLIGLQADQILIVAGSFGLLVAVLRFVRKSSRIALHSHAVEIMRPFSSLVIPYEDVRGIFSFDGGDTHGEGLRLLSQQAIVVGKQGWRSIHLGRNDHMALYHQLRAACEHSWAMRSGTALELPNSHRRLTRQSALGDLDLLLPVIRRAKRGAQWRGTLILFSIISAASSLLLAFTLKSILWVIFAWPAMSQCYSTARHFGRTITQLRRTQAYILEPSTPEYPFDLE